MRKNHINIIIQFYVIYIIIIIIKDLNMPCCLELPNHKGNNVKYSLKFLLTFFPSWFFQHVLWACISKFFHPLRFACLPFDDAFVSVFEVFR